MAEKGLGNRLSGLGALFGEAVLESDGLDCVYLPISKVEAGLRQPRKHFDEDALSELADSISVQGIIQPLTVRRLPNGFYQIIAGERRWRAAKMAGLDKVPAVIVEADDKKAMELALVENLQRRDLDPIEEAEGFRTLMNDYGLTQDETAERIGKSRSAVANSLRLLSLSGKAREYLECGKLSAGHARAVLSLKDSSLQDAFADRIVERDLSVRQAEELAKKFSKAKPSPETQPDDFVDYYAIAEKQLSDLLGRRVRIVHGKKKGRFELEYYDNDDLEQLIELLSSLNK